MTTSRFLFILLLALNALAFAAIQGWLGTAPPQGERERISNQLNPERVRLIAADKPTTAPAPAPPAAPARVEPSPPPAAAEAEAAAAAEAEAAAEPDMAPAVTAESSAPPLTEPVAEPVAEPAPPAETRPPPAVAAAAKPAGVCVAWTGLANNEADALDARLAAAGATGVRSRVEIPSSWWVRVPPQISKEQAERRVQELRQLGVTDTYIVQDAGPSQFAVSLGLFKTENRARLMLSQLSAKGVRNAGVEARTTSTYRVQVTLDEEARRAIEAAQPGLAASREACAAE